VDVLVCDDHPIVASAIAMTIEVTFDATVHVANSYRQALELAAGCSDLKLCLLDIHIPGEDARAGLRALQAQAPDARYMLFSGSEQDADLMMTMELGLHGFLPKSSTPELVEAALRLVLAGGTYLPSGIGRLAMRNAGMVEAIAEAPTPVTLVGTPVYGHLTDRQHDVLRHVALGRSNKEIARDMAISPSTVKGHVAQIIAVLGAANRTEASAKARDLGLISGG
jgi:DNA-binding NarL/FixJ family response regulator